MSEVDDFLNSYDLAKPAAARSQVDELMATAPSQDKGFLGHAKDVGLSALKGAISVPEAGVGIADIFTGGRVGKALENEGGAVGFRPSEARDFLNQLHTEGYQDQQQQFQQADGILGKAAVALRNPSLITNTVVESLPLMGAGGVVARGLMGRTRLGAKGVEGGVAASALGEGTVMAGSQAEGIRQETDSGLITPVQSAAAVGTGALGALFAFAGGRLAQKLGIGDVDTMLARGVTPQQVATDLATSTPKSIPRQVIEGAITEGFLEELPQEVSEQILQNLALGDPWHKDVEQAAVMGTLAGMAMGGAGAGYAGVVNKSPRTDTFRETPTDPGEAAPPAEPTPSGPAPGVGTPAPQVDPQYRTERFPSDSPRADTPLQIGMDPDAGTSPAPSLLLGLDPNAGPLSSAAAIAVDSGATQNLAEQEALAQAAETAQEQEKQSAQEKPDALRPEPAQPASDATVQGTRTPKQQKAIDRITNGKAFFFSQPKAQNFIDDNDLASTHELEQRGKSWHVVERKAEDAPAQESEARPESTVNAAAQQSEQIDAAAHEAATSPQNDLPEPTQAQKLAGNYSKGHVRVQGLDITIENPQGSERSGVDPDGNEWRHTMSHHYGYIKRTSGADGDQVDVHVGPNPTSDKVFVVDQIDQQSGRFDEHKVMVGYDDQAEAQQAYLDSYTPGWDGLGAITPMSVDEFKTWLRDGDTTKPVATTDRTVDAAADTVPARDDTATRDDREPTTPPDERAQTRDQQDTGLAGERSPEAIASLSALRDNPNAVRLDGRLTDGADASGNRRPEWLDVGNGFAARQYIWNGNATQEIRSPSGAIARRIMGRDGNTYAELEATTDLDSMLSGRAMSEFDQYFNRQIRLESAEKLASATDPAARRKAAEDKKAQALARRQQAYAEKKPFRAFLATHGVNVDDRSDVGGDRRRQMMVPNFGVVFRRNGARLDELARLALEEGFLTQADVDSDFDNGGVNKLSDLIRREIDGETIRPVDDESEWERMSRERDEAMEDAEAAMVELLTDDEINALADIAATEDAEISDGEIDEALGVVDTQEGGGQTEEGSARSEAGSDPSGRTEAGGGEPFELETTTPEVLRQQEQRQEKARQEEAERARRAEADAEEFVLTGSGRAVDQAIARGQQELMPATTQAATAVRTKAPAEKPTAGKSQAESGKAVEAKPGKAEVKPEGKIDDFGEKIEGARKDVWASFAQQMKDAEGEDIAAVPLSKSWPVPDYQALLDNGADPWAVGFLHAIRDEVPAKPRSRGINAWVAQVKMLRHLGMTGIREIMPPERTREMLEEERRGLGDVAGRAELYTLVGHSKSLAGVRVRRGEYSVFEGKHYRPPRIIWTVEKEAPKTAFSNWPRIFVRGDTREEAIANFKRDFEKIEITKPAAKEVTFGVYSKRGENGYWIGRKIGRNPVFLEGPFEKIADAREYLQSHNDDLLAKLDRAKAIPSERRDTNEPRVGEDMRNGADVTPEMFAEAFGFRGVQFGNYVEQGRRQKDLNDAFDALMDMAAIIGVPPRALSLNGELGLAFGARGTGGKNAAAAHYEPGHVVINLTKREGAGSLGHEWWHALDNYFSRMRKAPADYLTEADDVQTASRAGGKFVHRGEVRAEMIKAFGGVMRAINLTAIKSRSSKLDERRSKAYWTTKREMGARAFESYLISKLQDQGASNDYLANIVDEKTWAAAAQIGFEIDGSYPYPTAGEVPAIRAAFDHFFQTAQSRETDVGVMLFSRGPTTKAAYEARIDALFAGEKAATGTRVLDRSDVMRLLGYPDAPLLLNESHLLDGMASHPEMTPAQWKRVPGWIESPAVAYEDRGRIVMIAPDTVAGYPVRIVIEPEARRAGRLDETDQLLVTVFAKTTAPHLPNFGRLAADGAIRYLDTKKAPEVWQSGGAQFPKHATALQRRRKILTEKNLAGWRRANTLTYSFAGIRAEGADQMGLTTAQAQVDQGVDPEAVRRLTGWHRGADGKWRFEISDHQASLKVAGATFGELFADAHVNAYVAGRETPTVGDILEHDRLFAAYPALAEIPVAEMPAGQRALARLQRRAGGLRILVQPGMRRDAVVSAMLHELQHGIQLTEGFASGGSRHVLSAAMGEAGAKAYRRLAGEVEARNTQARQDMPPRSREVVPPEETADVAAADVIVTINGKRVEAPPQNAAPAAMTQGALRRAMSRQFPSLNRAFGRMLERGQSGERGGLVLVHDADPRAIARVFAQKTGRALSDAVQTFSNAGTINGFYDPRSGLTFMIMPNVDEVTAPAVILHEMVHGQQRKRLDKQAHDMIQNRARQKDGDLRAFLDRVAARMEDAGETSNQLEAAPYIVEQAVMEGRSQGQTLADSKFLTWVDKTIGKPVGDFLRSFLRGIRAWMLRNGMPIGQITVDDLVQYAMVGMERAAQGDVAGASGFSSGEQITRRGSEQDAIAAGFTMKAYRGISESAPFNDSGSTWSTTNREVALEYAEEVMGYDDPAVIEVMIRPDGLKRYDASRLTDEQRAALDADGLGNPQAIGIYDRSDDHTLGGGAGNVTVIHAPNSAIWLVDDGSLRFSRSGIQRVTAAATAELNRTFNVPGKLSWWHKTVGTMYNLAERSPHFKPVFESAQNFIDDVAYFATDAAELAPNLLPRLETWRDIAKRPITSKDNGAIAKPIFEGTLLWTRDENGAPVRLADGDEITSAGIVWTDAELRSMFGLNDKQVGLYREFREATNRSLDTMARADMIRYGGDDLKLIKARVMDASDVHEAARVIVEHLRELASVEPDRATSLMQVAHGIIERAARVKELQDQGYAPLSRFGQYTVDVVVDGARQYFGMFESKREANKMREAMAAEFGAANVTQGTLSNETYKLFAGVTPETLELFGTMLGLEGSGDQARDHAFQEYLRLTKTNRSAMRRLIHRKGVAGYSEDVGRVLASFVYSNSRQTAAGLNIGELGEAINAIPKEQGELKDAAVRLGEYIKNPQEEGQVIRGFLFAQYLGGSVASAFVNLTQPLQVTFPWLTQFTTASDSAAHIARAIKDMSTRGFKYDADLAAALKAAEDDGTVSPQEIHQLMGQARGSGSLRAGDGTRAGDARVAASNAVARFSLAWGKMFSAAEQANRRITFIAAYRIAREKGMADAAGFARHAVKETQFTYSKANKMRWGRGAVGGTLMTFKTYSISYIELMHRLWAQGEPGSTERAQGRKAALVMLGTLVLLSGAGGLPFAEDAEDVIDGAAQLMGYNFSIKKAREGFLEDVFGDAMAEFIDRGFSGIPGFPMDVSGRLGLGNLIPGTGLLQERTSHTRDVLEIVGPGGDFASRVVSGGRRVLGGDVGGGLLEMSPVAVRNLAKGADVAVHGMYRDTKGYKVLDTNLLEAAVKAAGIQPASVSKIQEANWISQRAKNYYNTRAQEIRQMWAAGIFENDMGKVQRARDAVARWDAKNPDQPMLIRIPDVMRRVREMAKTKDERIAATAPRAMRQQMREDLSRARANL